jgi:NADPH:quinone reductase-like Zn-dependent oxidoreductase
VGTEGAVKAVYIERFGGYADVSFPHILGRDVSGVIASVGQGVTSWRVGDEVFAVALQVASRREDSAPGRHCWP